MYQSNKSYSQKYIVTNSLLYLTPISQYEYLVQLFYIDPLGQPKVTAGRDHCFRTCCPSVLTFQI